MLLVILTPLTRRSPRRDRKMGGLSTFYAFSLHYNRQMQGEISYDKSSVHFIRPVRVIHVLSGLVQP